jgi:hypothetical protein
MPGSPVLTIVSSVTSGLVCADAGTETSMARKMPKVAIEVLNDASLLFFVVACDYRAA